ncbi:uncharacterized protein BXZ73DRAFT_82898 [Epithele typhae]|uniref:uncharacterized protein n=1 Tax=Epithele typhae TaxID=378194 RepID=UPI002008DAFD|nr:uncharacterized protein BXZ73DRAFT_82898 [Epithele typhae]KAH9911273.1 hypothetical protein BXZ73DRAFT_82898 [Epithele typhae]
MGLFGTLLYLSLAVHVGTLFFPDFLPAIVTGVLSFLGFTKAGIVADSLYPDVTIRSLFSRFPTDALLAKAHAVRDALAAALARVPWADFKVALLAIGITLLVVGGLAAIIFLVGFTPAGVVGGSLAAACIQSVVYGAFTMGYFSLFQSVGTMLHPAVMVPAIIAGAVWVSVARGLDVGEEYGRGRDTQTGTTPSVGLPSPATLSTTPHPNPMAARFFTRVVGGALAFAGLVTSAITALGFTSGGVLAGSAAAGIQSAFYAGSTGGAFSILQSIGATIPPLLPIVLVLSVKAPGNKYQTLFLAPSFDLVSPTVSRYRSVWFTSVTLWQGRRGGHSLERGSDSDAATQVQNSMRPRSTLAGSLVTSTSGAGTSSRRCRRLWHASATAASNAHGRAASCGSPYALQRHASDSPRRSAVSAGRGRPPPARVRLSTSARSSSAAAESRWRRASAGSAVASGWRGTGPGERDPPRRTVAAWQVASERRKRAWRNSQRAFHVPSVLMVRRKRRTTGRIRVCWRVLNYYLRSDPGEERRNGWYIATRSQ